MTWTTAELTAFAAESLAEAADSAKAEGMAAYLYGQRFQQMYPDPALRVPFYGVHKTGRTAVFRRMREAFPITGGDQYQAAVLALWRGPHREESYLAVDLANAYPEYATFERRSLYRRLIVEGAWWDLVDGVAPRAVGHVLLTDRRRMAPELDAWIDDDDLWVRRSALIAHLRHKGDTDEAQLFDHCLRRAHEQEFFIRKAIGWALRQYARTNPDAVRAFVLAHREELSGLSFREATKRLDLDG